MANSVASVACNNSENSERDAVSSSQSMIPKENQLWYLSYGSNMNPLVLSERRKVYPLKSLPCSVPGFTLDFNCQGIPYIEPSFASIHRYNTSTTTSPTSPNNRSPAPRDVHGVIHLITKNDMWAIRLSEGGNGHDGLGYDVHEVEVVTYSGQNIKALTLIYQDVSIDWNAHPSKRYMDLILDGATISGLEPSYIKYLHTFPIYQRKTYGQTIGTCLCGVVTLFLFLPLLFFIGVYRFWTNRRPPRASIIGMNLARAVIYLIHDFILHPFFGSGFISDD